MAKTTDNIRLQELAHKWLTGTLSREEQLEFDEWFRQVSDEPLEVPVSSALSETEHKKELYDSILHRIQAGQGRKLPIRWPRIAAAAILLLALAGSLYYYLGDQSTDPPSSFAAASNIAPGGNRATLTLPDGRTIDLSEGHDGIIIGGDNITYTDGSSLDVMLSGVETSPDQLVLTTPNAGQYQLTLPDGSRVWLNAGSTLQYPARFSGAERRVELVGEAYFEVAKDSQRPFHVATDGQEVEVLGTQFNVSAYRDDPQTKTTLVEGSVSVWINERGVPAKEFSTLRPGQQASVSEAGIQVREVDIEAATAWKDGYFKFDGDIKTIVAQIARWYDIEVTYDDDLATDLELVGRVSRARKLGDILRSLEEADNSIKFTLTGRRLHISK